MPRLGSTKKPIAIRVQTQERAAEVAAICNERGWYFMAEIAPDEPEDISSLERMLNPPAQVKAEKRPGRNDPCPCASGKKYKRCCG